jgi:hypothetical protein
MIIDDNEIEKEAMDCFRRGDAKQGHVLQDRFLADVWRSGLDHCSCSEPCPHHGKCVECVVIHRGHQDHLPNCFRDMVNRRLEAVSSLTEHTFRKE